MKKKSIVSLLAVAMLAVPGISRAASGSGAAYGRNIFTGAFVGGVIGAAAGLIPYSKDRKNREPGNIAYAATYGAIGTAVALAPLLSAYEVGAEKKGAGTTVLFSAMGFSLIGAAAGAGWSMRDYRNQVGTVRENDAEVILWNAGYGALGGAALGLVTGLWEILFWRESDSLIRPPGSGIHADLRFLQPSTVLKGPRQARVLPNIKIAQWQF